MSLQLQPLHDRFSSNNKLPCCLPMMEWHMSDKLPMTSNAFAVCALEKMRVLQVSAVVKLDTVDRTMVIAVSTFLYA
jgi:hypothetical protein